MESVFKTVFYVKRAPLNSYVGSLTIPLLYMSKQPEKPWDAWVFKLCVILRQATTFTTCVGLKFINTTMYCEKTKPQKKTARPSVKA